jgi:hypothetical protein
MADNPGPPADRERLEGLPQRFDVWQMAARQLGATVEAGGRAVRPWMTAVVSRTDGLVLAFELSQEPPTPAVAWEVLARAMQEPEVGEPHRPSEVQLSEQEWADALGPELEALNVGLAVTEDLDQVEEVFEGLGQQLAGHQAAGLLEMPGITPEAVGSFFDGAALFYHSAPWKKTGERPVRVACDRFDGSPWFAVLMGQAGMTSGLVLYDDLEALLRIQEGALSEEENARRTAALAVVFGGKDELSPADAAAAQEHGWPVAGPHAYPTVYRMDPGLNMRLPLAWELELLEGCLRAVPEFVRKKTRRLQPLTITVPVGSGELTLTLSWATD